MPNCTVKGSGNVTLEKVWTLLKIRHCGSLVHYFFVQIYRLLNHTATVGYMGHLSTHGSCASVYICNGLMFLFLLRFLTKGKIFQRFWFHFGIRVKVPVGEWKLKAGGWMGEEVRRWMSPTQSGWTGWPGYSKYIQVKSRQNGKEVSLYTAQRLCSIDKEQHPRNKHNVKHLYNKK